MARDIATAKRDMRRFIGEQLCAMTEEERSDSSAAICAELGVVLPHDGALLVFLPDATEPELDPCLGSLLTGGRRVCAPRCDWDSSTFAPVLLRSIEDVEIRRHRVREPLFAETVAMAELSAVLVPGTAFDPLGGRLGRGGGFYDRFLPSLPDSVRTIGVCFGCQVVDRVPREPHDAAVDELVTENGRVFSDRSSL